MTLPREWTEADILSLIRNGTKESIELDYKQSDALQKTDGKKKELGKDVSAFANSAGGTIVYGVEDDKYVPVRIDAGIDATDITKEWLEQVINSHIQPRLDCCYINQVELTTTRPGRVLYVVETPQATTRAPHQASDHRYYKRFNFASVPMEDYEVKDVLRRHQAPDLDLVVRRIRGWGDGQGFVTLGGTIANRGRSEARYVTCICQVMDGPYSIVQQMDPMHSHWMVREEGRACQYDTSNRLLVYPDLGLDLPSIRLRHVTSAAAEEPMSLQFSVYAEGMLGKHYAVAVAPLSDGASAVSIDPMNP